MPILNVNNLTTGVLDVTDAKKSFPAFTLTGSQTNKQVTLSSADAEQAIAVLDVLVAASKVSYTVIADASPSGDALEVYKRTVTVLEGDLVNAVNGGTAAINIGAVLPANARILGCEMSGLTPFTGAGATTCVVAVGDAGQVGAIIASADVLSAAVAGGPSARTAGIRPHKKYAAATQLIATFTPDAGHNLTALTAGAITIDVMFHVLP